MYLSNSGSYTYYLQGGEQHASRGDFLILATKSSAAQEQSVDSEKPYRYPLYGAVRRVALTQMGHFMMGFARIGGVSLTLSGEFGSDGLPCSPESKTGLTDDLIDRCFLRLPDDLAQKFWAEIDTSSTIRLLLSAWAKGTLHRIDSQRHYHPKQLSVKWSR